MPARAASVRELRNLRYERCIRTRSGFWIQRVPSRVALVEQPDGRGSHSGESADLSGRRGGLRVSAERLLVPIS